MGIFSAEFRGNLQAIVHCAATVLALTCCIVIPDTALWMEWSDRHKGS